MRVADEDLRHGGAAAGTADRLLARSGTARSVNFLESNAFLRQQRHRACTIGAEGLGIDFNLGHFRQIAEEANYARPGCSKRGSATRAAVSTSTRRAPLASSTLAQASAVAPDVITSST